MLGEKYHFTVHLIYILIWGGVSLSSGPQACQAAILPFEPGPQRFYSLVIFQKPGGGGVPH
jgi:hypothetical protein